MKVQFQMNIHYKNYYLNFFEIVSKSVDFNISQAKKRFLLRTHISFLEKDNCFPLFLSLLFSFCSACPPTK